MLLSRFPYPLEKGDKLRAYYQLRELSETYSITLITLCDGPVEKEHIAQVSNYCTELKMIRLNWFSKAFHILRCTINVLPFQVGYFYSWRAQMKIKQLLKTSEFKHIYCQLIRTSEYVKNIHHIPKTIDYMDALSAGVRRRIAKQPFYTRWLFRSETKRLVRYEQKIFDFFEHRTIISEQDKQLIAHPDKSKITVIPNGVDESFFEDLDRNEEFDLVFVGNMNYPPNISAVHYIAEHILTELPSITLLISGSSPHSSVQKLAAANSRIHVTGWVDDIRTSYCSGKIFLAPMMIGTGMQNKLLEAMALKTPCITTSLSNNAIKAENGKEVIVAEDAGSMVQAVLELLEAPQKRQEIAAAGRKFVEENYSWKKVTGPLIELMKTV